jgi:hypothetical protein
MTWHAFNGWLLANGIVTRVRFWANGMRRRGPIGGRHVSPSFWFIWLYKIYMGVHGVRPRDLPIAIRLRTTALPIGYHMLRVTYVGSHLFILNVLYFGREVGPGLGPDPWSYSNHITSTYILAQELHCGTARCNNMTWFHLKMHITVCLMRAEVLGIWPRFYGYI